jgi:hypothetical protein
LYQFKPSLPIFELYYEKTNVKSKNVFSENSIQIYLPQGFMVKECIQNQDVDLLIQSKILTFHHHLHLVF